MASWAVISGVGRSGESGKRRTEVSTEGYVNLYLIIALIAAHRNERKKR